MQNTKRDQTRDQKNYQHRRGEFKQWMGVQAVFGHLHAFREIPRSNPVAFSVRISVPQGRGEHMKYTSLELIVESLPAFMLLNQCADKINDEAVKATLTFNYYGAHPKAYALKNSDGTYKLNSAGELELRAFISGKLSHISYLKVDNVVIHGGESGNTKNNTQADVSRGAVIGSAADSGSGKQSKKPARKATA